MWCDKISNWSCRTRGVNEPHHLLDLDLTQSNRQFFFGNLLTLSFGTLLSLRLVLALALRFRHALGNAWDVLTKIDTSKFYQFVIININWSIQNRWNRLEKYKNRPKIIKTTWKTLENRVNYLPSSESKPGPSQWGPSGAPQRSPSLFPTCDFFWISNEENFRILAKKNQILRPEGAKFWFFVQNSKFLFTRNSI